MKFYTKSIPVTLAEKLKEKGMPMLTSVSISIIGGKNVVGEDGNQWYCPTYAEVFDWLMGRNILIILSPCYNATEDEIVGWISSVNLANKVLGDDFTFGFNYEEHLTGYEAANAAIEKAITLI